MQFAYDVRSSPLKSEAEKARTRLFFELLHGVEGAQLDRVTEFCSTFELEPAPTQELEALKSARRDNDAWGRVRAKLFLVAIEPPEERHIRRCIERNLPGLVLDLEGSEGRSERFSVRLRSGCRAGTFEVSHDRLPPRCYDPAAAQACECQHYPRRTGVDVAAMNERQRLEEAAVARRIGAREDVPYEPGEEPVDDSINESRLPT